MRYRIYNGDNDFRYIDAIGEYVYVSVHFRGTSVNIQPKGGFILGEEEHTIIDENYSFKYDDFPEFRNDSTAIRDSSINKCIKQFEKTITYQELMGHINDYSLGSLLDCCSNRENIEKDFYDYQHVIKTADKIFIESNNGLFYVITNYSKIVEELREIDIYCKKYDITQHWI
jgi:hypothetical protein